MRKFRGLGIHHGGHHHGHHHGGGGFPYPAYYNPYPYFDYPAATVVSEYPSSSSEIIAQILAAIQIDKTLSEADKAKLIRALLKSVKS